MKKLLILFLSLCTFTALSTAAAAVVSPGLNVIAAEKEMCVSVLPGESAVFSKESFCEALGREDLTEICIIALPASSEGSLYLSDAPLVENQVISARDVDFLTFVPAEGSEGGSFRFTVNDDYAMTCSIVTKDKVNNAPVSVGDMSLSVYAGTSCKGKLSANDPDGDILYYEVMSYPENGTLTVDYETGEFSYKAQRTPLYDSFTYRVCDSGGAYSGKAQVTLSVIESKNGTVFSDMEENACATAAIAMTDMGIMTCSENDGEITFSPSDTVTRLEFLVSAMNLFGADNIPTVSDTGFVDDSDIPEKYKGIVYSAAKLGIVKGIEKGDCLYFYPNRAITPEEASVILNNVIGYEPKSCSGEEPAWALEAVCAMKELGVYSVTDPAKFRRDDAAQLLYGISCLLYE